MKILRHKLCLDDGTPSPFIRSPNMGGEVEPKYLVIHYTAGSTTEGAVSWLTNKKSKASAHLVIGTDGSITQLVPFNRIAWHAGMSFWEGYRGLNKYSLGIELDNAGRLTKVGDKWRAWFKGEYEDDVVVEAVHKYGKKPHGWHVYTEQQIEAAIEVGILLVNTYGLLDVVGHDDISPRRKWDPGPAFPMESYRARLKGRMDENPVIYETVSRVNIRTDAGSEHGLIGSVPLLEGTRVEVLDTQGGWRLVDVLDEIDGVMDLQGWVLGRFLKRVDG